MTRFLPSFDPRPLPTPRRLRTISPIAISPIPAAPFAFAFALLAGAVAPSMSAAADEATAPADSRSAGTAWRFTKDGAQELVLTPEQKARQAARKAKRKERHAAEKVAAASKADPVKNGAQGEAGKPAAVPEGKEGAAKVGD